MPSTASFSTSRSPVAAAGGRKGNVPSAVAGVPGACRTERHSKTLRCGMHAAKKARTHARVLSHAGDMGDIQIPATSMPRRRQRISRAGPAFRHHFGRGSNRERTRPDAACLPAVSASNGPPCASRMVPSSSAEMEGTTALSSAPEPHRSRESQLSREVKVLACQTIIE